jgi:hypothetical protein
MKHHGESLRRLQRSSRRRRPSTQRCCAKFPLRCSTMRALLVIAALAFAPAAAAQAPDERVAA